MHVQVTKNDNKTLAALQEATLFGQAFTCTYTVSLATRGTGKKKQLLIHLGGRMLGSNPQME